MANSNRVDNGAMEIEELRHDTTLSLRTMGRLYVSHFLSTWNSRLFEMGAVLFLAAIFPDTLRPMSIYALVRNAAAIAFSPAVGSWIDRGNRLHVVRVSIIGQRLAVGASCGVFWILQVKRDLGSALKEGLFALTIILACMEKLCAIMNLVSVERDWVVVISDGNEEGRRLANARLRRIDLFCKLFGPLAISLIDGVSTLVAIWVTLAMSCVSLPVEYMAIEMVYKMVPSLQRAAVVTIAARERPSTEPRRFRSMLFTFIHTVRANTSHVLPVKSLPYYFQHPAFLPSIALAMLYLTVLSFSGQMITFLLATGYSSFYVGIARTISAVFEICATWIAPRVQQRIGAIRGGIWFLTWQMLWLAVGLSWFFATGAALSSWRVFAASGLVGSVILSRVGLWGFDLCAQSIVQQEVDEQSRGAFSTVEASFQNLFEMLSYLTTVAFARPDQFKWPIVISVVATYAAGATYAIFVRTRRGHLVHLAHWMKS